MGPLILGYRCGTARNSGELMGAFSVGITRKDWHDTPGNRNDGVY